MAAPEVNNPENNLDQELHARQGQEVKSVDDTIDSRMDWSIQKMGDLSTMTTNRMKELYKEKAAELTREAERLEGKLQDDEILDLQKVTLGSLKERLSIMLEIAGGSGSKDTVSTPQELVKLNQDGIAVIANTNIPGLVYAHLKTLEKNNPLKYAGLAERYETTVGKSIDPDTIDVLRKTADDKGLEGKDWDVLTFYLQRLDHFPERAVGLGLLNSLKPDQLRELIQHLPQDADFPQMTADLVASDHLSRDQVETFLLPQIQELQKDPKANAAKLKLFSDTLVAIHDPKVDAFQKNVEEAKMKMPQLAGKMVFGQRNIARQMLTFRGIGSTFLAVNGALTVGANFLMGLGDPKSLPGNRAIWLGAAEMGIGLETSHGVEGLVPQPSKVLSGVLRDKNEAASDQAELDRQNFSKSFGNHPQEARFYYTFAEKIMKAYQEQVKIQGNGRPKLTMEDLGLKWENLPEIYRGEPHDFFEREIADWAATYALKYKMEVYDDDTEGQRSDMNEMRKKYRGFVEDYQRDPELEKLLKPAE